jgi:hypothetical protein
MLASELQSYNIIIASIIRSALMMGAARTSETLVNFYQTTRRYNLEDSHLRSHRRENLKSYTFFNLQCLIIHNPKLHH